MKIKLLLILTTVFLASCGTNKQVVSSSKTKRTSKVSRKKAAKATFTAKDAIVKTALAYRGTPYKYAGISHKGMDCSGLMFTSFKKHNVLLPRVSREQAKQGKKISLGMVKKGDLLFFHTNKNHKRINHVGLVVENGGEIKFVHSSSSKGVIVSSLNERYWKAAFAEARRVL